MISSELKRMEELKRERHWTPADRWRVIQETITWAADQPTVQRNTPGKCKEKERRLLQRTRL